MIPERGVARSQKVAGLTNCNIRKKTQKASPRSPLHQEMLSFWVWVAIFCLVGQVVGFVFGDRSNEMLSLLWHGWLGSLRAILERAGAVSVGQGKGPDGSGSQILRGSCSNRARFGGTLLNLAGGSPNRVCKALGTAESAQFNNGMKSNADRRTIPGF
jgi:hypothetical protein